MDEIIDDPRESPKGKHRMIFTMLWFIYGYLVFEGYIFKIINWEGTNIYHSMMGYAGITGHLIIFGIFKSKNALQRTVAYTLALIVSIMAYHFFIAERDIFPLFTGLIIFSLGVSFLLRN